MAPTASEQPLGRSLGHWRANQPSRFLFQRFSIKVGTEITAIGIFDRAGRSPSTFPPRRPARHAPTAPRAMLLDSLGPSSPAKPDGDRASGSASVVGWPAITTVFGRSSGLNLLATLVTTHPSRRGDRHPASELALYYRLLILAICRNSECYETGPIAHLQAKRYALNLGRLR